MREKWDADTPMNGPMFEVLVALSGDDVPVAALYERIRASRNGSELPLATLYRHLQRAEEAGWVRSAEPPGPEGPGRPRRSFGITERGRAAVRAEAQRLSRLTAHVLEPSRGA